MNRRSRRASEAGAITLGKSETPQSAGLIRAALTYAGVGQPVTLMVQPNQFVAPEKTFAADCARARLRIHSPELQFVQLDPYDPQKISRSVLVRFDRGRFIERAKNHPVAIAALTKQAEEGSVFYKPGEQLKLLEAATVRDDHVAIMLDAELEVATWLGGRAGIVFISVPQNELASVLATKAETVWLRPELEVTLPAGTLVDLLTSWKAVAEGLSP